MAASAVESPICSLCGQRIATNPANPDDSLSMEHVPPQQFFPKEMRASANLNLWRVPTHRRCNADYRKDEEYFYHAVYPLVQNGNRAMAQVIHRDLMRRRKKPQSPAMARRLLKEFRTVTDGGILLLPGVLQFSLDLYRAERVAIKIAQGLFYLDQKRYVPRASCKDIHLCQVESDVPERYRLSWQGAEAQSVSPSVFSYRRFELDNLHLFSMVFWGAFMFCLAFEGPQAIDAPAA